VAAVYDALTSDRRPAHPGRAGNHFCPEIIKVFRRLLEKK
jgi:HD-GYP domain-containing protein (c-di-GMP phosphodiesterase class II)